jgi:molybdopterin-guanine dinucleotide biosynthesis protein MobB
MKRIHLLGRKNHGKTTLVVELVEYLTARGLRVGTIKHTHHAHELDAPGKDSHRHRTAGSSVVGILSPKMNAVFWAPADGEDDNRADADRYAAFAPHFATCDVVIVEGDTLARELKIEVYRAAVGGEPLAASDPAIVAVVTDDQPAVAAPLWPRRDVPAIADRVLQLLRDSD